MANNKLRNMTADEAVELIVKLRDILEHRKFFGYNSNLSNSLKEKLQLVRDVYDKYKPVVGDANTTQTLGSRVMQNILDVHGMSILNSILEINAISTRFTDKYFSKASTFTNAADLKYAEMINETDEKFVSFINDKGGNGTEELNRVKTLLSNFETGVVKVRPVTLTVHGSEENITEAFDYHLLAYLVMCMEIENEIFFEKRRQFLENKQAFINAGNDESMYHTSYFGDVSSCRSSCVGLCAASCDQTCYGCGGHCAGQCTSSCGDCSKSCTSTCSNNCMNGCTGCNGCTGACTGCSTNCTRNCGGNCTGGCGSCDGSCYGTSSGTTSKCGCGSVCTTECSSSCSTTSSSPTKVSTSANPPIVVNKKGLTDPESVIKR